MDCGFIQKKIIGALLQINQAKGYGKIWTVGSECWTAWITWEDKRETPATVFER